MRLTFPAGLLATVTAAIAQDVQSIKHQSPQTPTIATNTQSISLIAGNGAITPPKP